MASRALASRALYLAAVSTVQQLTVRTRASSIARALASDRELQLLDPCMPIGHGAQACSCPAARRCDARAAADYFGRYRHAAAVLSL
jgi:hypothetical protein